MKNILPFLIIFIFSNSIVYGQYGSGLRDHRDGSGYSIIMLGTGPAYLHGDIGGRQLSGIFKETTFNIKSTRSFFTFGYRYTFPNNLSVRANFLYGNFVGSDTLTYLEPRKYNFKSDVFETSIQAEWFIIGGPLNNFEGNPHSLYIFAGAGNVSFVPTLGGNSRSQDIIKTQIGNAAIIPLGVGYEVAIGDGFSIGSELGFRYAFSDFLDGLKTPYSNSNDMLVNFNVVLSYNLSLGMY